MCGPGEGAEPGGWDKPRLIGCSQVGAHGGTRVRGGHTFLVIFRFHVFDALGRRVSIAEVTSRPRLVRGDNPATPDVIEPYFLRGTGSNRIKALPGGASMRVAARRSTRVGTRAGVPLEDLGVKPDERYFMTRDDLLKGNVDLIAHAAKLLAARPQQVLRVEAAGGPPVAKLKVTTAQIDRVDIDVDGRPVASVDVTASPTQILLPKPVAAGRVAVKGYRDGALVASAAMTIP